MKKIYKILLICSLVFLFGFDTHRVNRIISESVKIEDQGERISFISSQFMDVPYQSNTLIGSPDEKEVLVINLNRMDCFTFLDYVEALRLSVNADDFVINLKDVRYFKGEVAYGKRRHFFTDWVSGDHNSVKDITSELPGSIMVEKYINRKSDKKNWLKNLPNTMRMVTYVPAEKISKDLIKMLKTGDYIGIYTGKEGLDVTHTGIFIRNKNGEFFRNTSSKAMKITDYIFSDYIKEVPGIIVLRPM